MSDKNTRREIVKKGIATVATVGALGSVGSAAASSSGKIYIDASSAPAPDGTYYLELEFDSEQDNTYVGTDSGEFADSNWRYEPGLYILEGWVEPGASIEMSYKNTEASYNEAETDEEVTIVIQ